MNKIQRDLRKMRMREQEKAGYNRFQIAQMNNVSTARVSQILGRKKPPLWQRIILRLKKWVCYEKA